MNIDKNGSWGFLTSMRWYKVILGGAIYLLSLYGLFPTEAVQPVLVVLGVDVGINTWDKTIKTVVGFYNNKN